jgi:hypothetical protein
MNSSTNYPLIPNAQEYMYQQKFVSISSLDIDQVKNPISSQFEIELPQDYCNVQSISLSSYTFPNNLNVFTKFFKNIWMTFIINQPYYPTDTTLPNYSLNFAIYTALYNKSISSTPNFLIEIDDGLYQNVPQMNFQLTNKFNYTVSLYIIDYFTTTGDTVNLQQFMATGQYTQFNIQSDVISQIMTFGNQSSGFILTNDSTELYNIVNEITCSNVIGTLSPQDSLLGLPWFLGFTDNVKPKSYPSLTTANLNLLRFFSLQGTTGIWLVPSYSDSPFIHYVQAPNKWNIFAGRYYMFMEIAGFNSIDETQPFDIYNLKPTSGKVNSAFAKIPLYGNPVVPVNNIFYNGFKNDNVLNIFTPPIQRIKKLSVKFRYHNGEYVNFAGATFSFTLKFNIFLPQNAKKYSMYKPEST